MRYTILDCYTDEPSGLGVPPYLGTYPRYLFGKLSMEGSFVNYITIDDLRYFKKGEKKKQVKTDISTYNLTKNKDNISFILKHTEVIIVVLGVHVPGKYLSAIPGTLKEVTELISDVDCEKILTGPAIFGTQLEGGKFFEKADNKIFDKIENFDPHYNEIKDYSVSGAKIIEQIPDLRIIEIETGHGCDIGKCSFCMEPIKHNLEFREIDEIIDEVEAFYTEGCKFFRLGKQSCFYTYPNSVELLKKIREKFKEIKVLHIDNVNPVKVINDRDNSITKAIVKYCTPGNVAAFGIESLDSEVVKINKLNCNPEISFRAIEILNKFGRDIGENGMPKFLPGLNIIFGLNGESKETHNHNMEFLKKILKSNMLLRRINIRQVGIFEGTPLFKEVGNKFLKKNNKFYWKWRNEIRQTIDYEMLKRLMPLGHVLKDIRMEVHDGNTTFGRQIGTYPLIVGVKERLELGKFFDIKVREHMLRSIVGEIVK